MKQKKDSLINKEPRDWGSYSLPQVPTSNRGTYKHLDCEFKKEKK